MTTPPDLAPAVGRRMRSLRDLHNVTADTIASQARRLGLRWQRSTVASIETGKRGLSAEELLLLPTVLSMALPARVSLRDLLDRDIALTDEVVMTPRGFSDLIEGAGPIWGGFKLPRQTRTAAQTPSVERWRVLERFWPEVHGDERLSLQRLQQVERAAAGEAEQNAARILGVDALEVSAAAHGLWGHSLTAERDVRVEAGSSSDAPASAVRARRGHVTRTLLAELKPWLAVAAEAPGMMRLGQRAGVLPDDLLVEVVRAAQVRRLGVTSLEDLAASPAQAAQPLRRVRERRP
jgi:transcriptional regulator with XRE-family HTH domain